MPTDTLTQTNYCVWCLKQGAKVDSSSISRCCLVGLLWRSRPDVLCLDLQNIRTPPLTLASASRSTHLGGCMFRASWDKDLTSFDSPHLCPRFWSMLDFSASPKRGFAKGGCFAAMISWKCALRGWKWHTLSVRQCPSTFYTKKNRVRWSDEDDKTLHGFIASWPQTPLEATPPFRGTRFSCVFLASEKGT